MAPRSSRVDVTKTVPHRISQSAVSHSASTTPETPTPSPRKPSYTFHDIFLDPDPRIPLWERIKGGASLSLVPFALFCGGSPRAGAEGAGADAIGNIPDASGDVVSGKDAGRSDGSGTDGEIRCDPDTYVAKDYTRCGMGICRRLVPATLCVDGRIVPNNEEWCVPGTPLSAGDTTCDGVDDDCNGGADEDHDRPTGEPCGLLPGACRGTEWMVCGWREGIYGERVECRGEAWPTLDLCGDGIDNDCDGYQVDEWLGIGEECEVGVGVCYRGGVRVCADEGIAGVCSTVPGEPTGPDDDCNGLDDDCDGAVDEHFVPMPTLNTCGVGACEASAVLYCHHSRGLEEYCEPRLSPMGVDYICNGIDDDCDGDADEEYTGEGIRYCGEGACGFFAITEECIDGTVVDYGCPPPVEPIGPIGLDNDCNGYDEDCDGEADEHFQPITTVCGVGESISEGILICIEGSLECVPDS